RAGDPDGHYRARGAKQRPRGRAARRGRPHHHRGGLARCRPGAGAAPRLRAPGSRPRPLAARHVAVRSRGARRPRHPPRLPVPRLPRPRLAAVHRARSRRGGPVARRRSGLPLLRGGRGDDRPEDGAAARAGRPAAGRARRRRHAHGPARRRAVQRHVATPAPRSTPERDPRRRAARQPQRHARGVRRRGRGLALVRWPARELPGRGAAARGRGDGPGAARRHAGGAGADRRVYVDSLRLSQPGLITTGSGVLGWARPARGTLSLDLDADSLNSVDSLIAWVAGRALGREGGGGGRSLAGAARVAVTLEGALDSLAVEARASLERLRWREWEVPAGRARVTYRPGPVPAIAGEVTLDSLALGERGFGAATASVAGTRDSLAWFARSRVGQVGAVLAGGRYVRRAD